jgi:subtilisin family serine protease
VPRVKEGFNARAWANPSDYQDDNGHGTHIAGIIAANLQAPAPGISGMIGVAPEVTFLAVKVLDKYGAGYLSDFVNGLQWVYDYKNSNKSIPLVANMSIGFSTDSVPLQRAIQGLFTRGVIMVASAGNRCGQSPDTDEGGGDDCDEGPSLDCDLSQTAVKYPAAYHSWVIAAGAIDYYQHVAAYSLTGNLDVVAPGGSKATEIRILSTTTGIGNNYGWGSGTSQAAAHVTGAVALALQLQPGLLFQGVRSVLQTTATPLFDLVGQRYPKNQQGEGLINVDAMVQKLLR